MSTPENTVDAPQLSAARELGGMADERSVLASPHAEAEPAIEGDGGRQLQPTLLAPSETSDEAGFGGGQLDLAQTPENETTARDGDGGGSVVVAATVQSDGYGGTLVSQPAQNTNERLVNGALTGGLA